MNRNRRFAIRLSLPVFAAAALLAFTSAQATRADAPLTERTLDWEWQKSVALEAVINQKLSRIIEGSGISPTRFKSNATVLFDKQLVPPKPAPVDPNVDKNGKKDKPADQLQPKKESDQDKEQKKEQDELGLSGFQANPLDLDSLLAKFQADDRDDQGLVNRLTSRAPATTADQETKPLAPPAPPVQDIYRYIVSMVTMNVTLDQSISEGRAKELETYLKTAFSPAFGSHLIVQVKPEQLIQPGFWDQLKRFQTLALAALASAVALLMMLFFKLIPGRRSAFELKLNQERKNEALSSLAPEKNQDVASNTDKPDEEKDDEEEEEKPPATPVVSQEVPAFIAPPRERDWEVQASQLENQIAELVRANPTLSRLMIQDFLRSEPGPGSGGSLESIDSSNSNDSMIQIAILLETLAKFKVQAEKFTVKGETLKRFQNVRSRISKINTEERAKNLEELYWSLVSLAFLTEGDQSLPTFHFLEMLDEGKILKILAREPVELQAMILLGMGEKKSAKVIQKVSQESRQVLFERICSGKVPSPEELKSLAERVRERSIPLLAAQSLPTSPEEGIPVISLLLEQLDFKAQFESVKNLFVNSPELRRQMKGTRFFIGFLPEARPEFLKTIFVDRDNNWMNAVISGFEPDFKAQVLSVLPPMQQRMLESASADEVSVAARLKIMGELQSEIRAKIEKREIALEEIFDLSDTFNASPYDSNRERHAA